MFIKKNSLVLSLLIGIFMSFQAKSSDTLLIENNFFQEKEFQFSPINLELKDQELNKEFIDHWDEMELRKNSSSMDKVRALTMENCIFDENLDYHFLQSFINCNELKIIGSRINSKILNNLLINIDNFSLKKIDFSRSNFEFLLEEDLPGVQDAFFIEDIIFPEEISQKDKEALEKLFNFNKQK